MSTTNNGERQSEGSQELLADSPMILEDPVSKLSFSLYESVLNSGRADRGRFSEIRAYITPIIMITEVKCGDDKNGITPITINYTAYHNGMKDKVVEQLTYQYSSRVKEKEKEEIQNKLKEINKEEKEMEIKFRASHSNVSYLPISKITYSIKGLENAKEVVSTSTAGNIILDANQMILFTLPTYDLPILKKQLEKGEFQVVATLYFTSKDVQMASISWSDTDLTNSKRYQNLKTSGAAFVDAKDVSDMVKESIRSRNIQIMQDPNFPPNLFNILESNFNKLLAEQSEESRLTKEESLKAQSKLLEGIGLEAKDYQPITAMWNVADSLNKSTNESEANQAIKTFFEKTKLNTSYSTKIGAKASFFGFIKGKGGSNFNINYSRDTDNSKYFDDKTFKEFKESISHLNSGLEPRITARGLGLVETTTFEENIKTLIGGTSFYPVSQSKSKLLTSSIYSMANNQNDIIPLVLGATGTISIWGGNIDKIPSGYLICDGSELNVKRYPELAKVLVKNDGSPIRVPDLRGRTIVGSGQGSGLTNRITGAIGGAESVSLSIAQMPSHNHSGHTTSGEKAKYIAVYQSGKASNPYHFVAFAGGDHKTVGEFGPHNHPNSISDPQGDTNYPVSHHTHGISSEGGSQSHENMPPFIVLQYIIKT